LGGVACNVKRKLGLTPTDIKDIPWASSSPY
jgi:hypothetical protein